MQSPSIPLKQKRGTAKNAESEETLQNTEPMNKRLQPLVHRKTQDIVSSSIPKKQYRTLRDLYEGSLFYLN